jgi:hypothetical protein
VTARPGRPAPLRTTGFSRGFFPTYVAAVPAHHAATGVNVHIYTYARDRGLDASDYRQNVYLQLPNRGGAVTGPKVNNRDVKDQSDGARPSGPTPASALAARS